MEKKDTRQFSFPFPQDGKKQQSLPPPQTSKQELTDFFVISDEALTFLIARASMASGAVQTHPAQEYASYVVNRMKEFIKQKEETGRPFSDLTLEKRCLSRSPSSPSCL